MREEKNSKVNAEVEKRLADLFGEGFQEEPESDEPRPSPSIAAETEKSMRSSEHGSSSENSPLRALKSILLSLDWEITDGLMDNFIDQIDSLKEVYKVDKISFLLLRLLEAIGRYIKVKQGKAHPEAIRVLNSEYESFEKLATSSDMAEKERKEILLAEVNRFKDLKERIASVKSKKSKRRNHETPIEPARGVREGANLSCRCEDCLEALNELKRFIKTEIDALRAELKLLKKTQEETR